MTGKLVEKNEKPLAVIGIDSPTRLTFEQRNTREQTELRQEAAHDNKYQQDAQHSGVHRDAD